MTTIEPGDYRRAVAAMRHAARDDLEGILAILDEATPRAFEFLYAVLDLHQEMLTAAYNEGGAHEVLNTWTLHLAAQETGDQE